MHEKKPEAANLPKFEESDTENSPENLSGIKSGLETQQVRQKFIDKITWGEIPELHNPKDIETFYYSDGLREVSQLNTIQRNAEEARLSHSVSGHSETLENNEKVMIQKTRDISRHRFISSVEFTDGSFVLQSANVDDLTKCRTYQGRKEGDRYLIDLSTLSTEDKKEAARHSTLCRFEGGSHQAREGGFEPPRPGHFGALRRVLSGAGVSQRADRLRLWRTDGG